MLPNRQFYLDELLGQQIAADDDLEEDTEAEQERALIMADERPLRVEFVRNQIRVVIDGYWISGTNKSSLRLISNFAVHVVGRKITLVRKGELVITRVLEFSDPLRILSLAQKIASEAIQESFPDRLEFDLPDMPTELMFLGQPTVSDVDIDQGWMYLSVVLQKEDANGN